MLSILIVEDHPLFRNAIFETLERVEFVGHVGQAGNGIEALEAMSHAKFDLVLLDIQMPEMDGIACMKEIKNRCPDQKVVVLTQFDSAGFYRKFETLGAYGYLLKSSTEREIIEAIRSVVFENKRAVSTNIAQTLMNITESAPAGLTQVELKVVRLICQHLKSVEIADQMNLSIHTINTHRKNILHKIEADSPTQVIEWAITNNLSSLTDP
ncbi:MAG: response regulator transcription factor [Salibacteraceae bacterium]